MGMEVNDFHVIKIDAEILPVKDKLLGLPRIDAEISIRTYWWSEGGCVFARQLFE